MRRTNVTLLVAFICMLASFSVFADDFKTQPVKMIWVSTESDFSDYRDNIFFEMEDGTLFYMPNSDANSNQVLSLVLAAKSNGANLKVMYDSTCPTDKCKTLGGKTYYLAKRVYVQ